ncbi:MAG: PAS domain-containing protein [Planctomycetia bacterium]|nr:MAG: PAS domain-containing protein [Planctomycetia bacterium]RIK68764.1 MAG: hypothetical protein DCC66_09695 [Planctomycetota bacterium]
MATHPKPWAFLDDDDDASSAAAPSSFADDTSARSAAPRLRSRVLKFVTSFQSRLNLDPRWSALPIGLIAIWICIATAVAPSDLGLARWNGFVVTLFAAAAMTILLIGRSAAGDGRDGSREAMRQALAQRLGIAPGGDAESLWTSIEAHATNIEQRVNELVQEQRRLQLEASLHSAQRRNLEAILHGMAEPLLVVDRFERIVFVNQVAAELLEITTNDAIRQPLDQVVSNAKLIDVVRQACQADARAARRRVELDFGDRAFALSMAPLPDSATADGTSAQSSAHGLVVLFRDVTCDRLAAKAKSEFVAHVSHELRTPLSSIRAYTEMLVDGEATDEKTRAEYYGIIQTSADRLGRLIDNMLNISRIEAGTVRINKEPVAVSIIVKEVADSLKPQAEEKNIALLADLAPVVDRVMADRDLLYQAVLNLASNAIKYTPEGGEVTVRMITLEEQNALRIEVSDTGVGIPAEDLPHMFEKFYRVEANKHMAKGTGLGLNLVKNIVEVVHEGKVSLRSEVGKGSTFAITLNKVT